MAEVADDPSDPFDGLQSGTRVRIDGLKSKPELNGEHATIESFVSETGRCNIKLDSTDQMLALKPAVLQICEEFAHL